METRTPEQADALLDQYWMMASINPDGFPSVYEGHARQPTISKADKLMLEAHNHPLPVRTRSPRGERKAAGYKKSVERIKEHQSRLQLFREVTGNLTAKKLPKPDWGDDRQEIVG